MTDVVDDPGPGARPRAPGTRPAARPGRGRRTPARTARHEDRCELDGCTLVRAKYRIGESLRVVYRLASAGGTTWSPLASSRRRTGPPTSGRARGPSIHGRTTQGGRPRRRARRGVVESSRTTAGSAAWPAGGAGPALAQELRLPGWRRERGGRAVPGALGHRAGPGRRRVRSSATPRRTGRRPSGPPCWPTAPPGGPRAAPASGPVSSPVAWRGRTPAGCS